MAATDAVLSGQLGVAPADLTTPATPVEVRERLLDLLRRDLVGPHPDLDPDLAREVLTGVAPSTWYLSGFLGPRQKIPGGRAAPRRQQAPTLRRMEANLIDHQISLGSRTSLRRWLLHGY